MNTLHPIFAAICNTHVNLLKVTQRIQRTVYVAMLKAHDWSYEYCDDATVYRQGRVQRGTLQAAQKEIDCDGAIWNQHAPNGYRISSLQAKDTPIIAARIKELM